MRISDWSSDVCSSDLKTKDHVQSIHIDLHANRLSMEEARTVINRFLSLMTWCDDQYAIAQDGWSGNPVPVAVPKRTLAFPTTSHWAFNRAIPVSEHVLRPLALHPQGRDGSHSPGERECASRVILGGPRPP